MRFFLPLLLLISTSAFAQNIEPPYEPATNTSEKPVYSPLSPAQKTELFWEGTVTDAKGQIWNIRVMPGATLSNEVLRNGWKWTRYYFAKLFDKNFYVNEVGETVVRPGWELTKGSFRWSKTILRTAFSDLPREVFDMTSTYWNDMTVENQRLGAERPIGWFMAKLWNRSKAVTAAVAGVCGTAVGACFLTGVSAATAGLGAAVGTATAAVATAYTVAQPIIGLADVPVRGTIVPLAMHAWNCATYATITGTGSNVPTREFGRWVVLNPKIDDSGTPRGVIRDHMP